MTEEAFTKSYNDRLITLTYKNHKVQFLPGDDLSDDDIKILISRFRCNIDDYIHFEIESIKWLYCLVGNIVETHEYGENKAIKSGTKHFSAGTKVYCYPGRWGDGYENIYVIGKPRKSFQLIKVIMPSKYITNFRLKKVFNRRVIKEMYYDGGWDNREETKKIIIEFPKNLNVNSRSLTIV